MAEDVLFRFGDKQPYEAYHVEFPFAADLDKAMTAATISTATVTVTDTSDNSDVTSTLTDVTLQRISPDAKSVYVWVKAGTDGHEYKISCKVVAVGGVYSPKYELDAILPVTEY